MALEILIANDADSVLTADLAVADVALTVRLADAARFPNPALGAQAFYTTLERKNMGEREIVLVTARAGDIFTIARAQDGSVARTFKAGDLVGMRTNKAAIDAYLAQQASLAAPTQSNAITGGNFGTNPWQDGPNVVNPASGVYITDNVQYVAATTGTLNGAKTADGPTVAQAGELITHCLDISVTAADAAVAAADFAFVRMMVEGYDWISRAQRALALRFWHKHSKAGTYCVSLQNNGLDRALVMEYQQAVADTWEEAILDLPASPAAGTWDYTNGVGIRMNFVIMCGANAQTAAGAWAVGNFFASANQVNAFDTNGNRFRIANVRLGTGNAATARFTTRTEGEELRDAQRRYERSYPIGIAAPTNANSSWEFAAAGAAVAAGSVVGGVDFAVRKRTVPNVTVYSYTASTANAISSGVGADLAANSGNVLNPTDRGFKVQNNSGGAVAPALNGFVFHWKADARF